MIVSFAAARAGVKQYSLRPSQAKPRHRVKRIVEAVLRAATLFPLTRRKWKPLLRRLLVWARNYWVNPFYSSPFFRPPSSTPRPFAKKNGRAMVLLFPLSEGGCGYTCASATAGKTLLLKSRFFCFKVCRAYSNGPLQLSHSRDTKPPHWRAKVALGHDKQRKLRFKILYVFCFSCPSATYALQQGGFVPRVTVRVSCNTPICSKCQLKAIFPGVVFEKKYWILDPKIYTNSERAKTSLTANRLFGVSLMWKRKNGFHIKGVAPRPARLVLKRRIRTNYCVLI